MTVSAAFGLVLLPLAEAAGSTAAIYLFLILAMRLFSRRQIGQLTVVDLVVVLLLGSAVETAMIHGNTSLPVGLASAATLLALNRALTWCFLRSTRLRHLVNGGPVLLVRDGEVVAEHLRRVGMTRPDVEEAVREKGYASFEGVRFAVLETDGTVSVIARRRLGDGASGP